MAVPLKKCSDYKMKEAKDGVSGVGAAPTPSRRVKQSECTVDWTVEGCL